MLSREPLGKVTFLPGDPLLRAVWTALATAHPHLARRHGLARRYLPEVAPFAALAESTPAALADLQILLQPGELTYLLGERPPDLRGLRHDGAIPCLQMVFPRDASLFEASPASPPILPLTCLHSAEMLALINLAFPGFFRAQTCRMGRYWGLRDANGTLVAMGGERLVLTAPGKPPWHEISGLCTHPAHPGKGLGTALLGGILAQHRVEGTRSWLHVTATNTGAISLYRRLGFRTVRHIALHRLVRTPA